jgi:hypothetical protein
MENVIEEVKSRTNLSKFSNSTTLWYKLFADDLVLICRYLNLPELLKNLMEVSAAYKLKISTKKSAIMIIKNRRNSKIDL